LTFDETQLFIQFLKLRTKAISLIWKQMMHRTTLIQECLLCAV
jgi:hypothetical protein